MYPPLDLDEYQNDDVCLCGDTGRIGWQYCFCEAGLQRERFDRRYPLIAVEPDCTEDHYLQMLGDWPIQ